MYPEAETYLSLLSPLKAGPVIKRLSRSPMELMAGGFGLFLAGDGNLYGPAVGDPNPSVFQYSLSAGTLTTLWTSAGAPDAFHFKENNVLEGPDGSLWGTSAGGGTAGGTVGYGHGFQNYPVHASPTGHYIDRPAPQRLTLGKA